MQGHIFKILSVVTDKPGKTAQSDQSLHCLLFNLALLKALLPCKPKTVPFQDKMVILFRIFREQYRHEPTVKWSKLYKHNISGVH